MQGGGKSHYFDISDRPAATDASDGSNALCEFRCTKNGNLLPQKQYTFNNRTVVVRRKALH
jgi:hypothetical protein